MKLGILVMYQTLFAAFLGITFSEARDFCFACVLALFLIRISILYLKLKLSAGRYFPR